MIADAHACRRQVGVVGNDVVAIDLTMADPHHVAITTSPADERHDAVGRGADRRATGGSKIETRVQFVNVQHRVHTHAERRRAPPIHRRCEGAVALGVDVSELVGARWLASLGARQVPVFLVLVHREDGAARRRHARRRGRLLDRRRVAGFHHAERFWSHAHVGHGLNRGRTLHRHEGNPRDDCPHRDHRGQALFETHESNTITFQGSNHSLAQFR